MPHDTPLIQTEKLTKIYKSSDASGHTRNLRAVDGVDLGILRGETFALVGESGCGKTTLGRMLMRLERESSGRIFYDGADVTSLRPGRMSGLQSKMQIIYQNSARSLDPYMRIRDSLLEPLNASKMQRGEKQEYIEHLLRKVGLDPYEMEKYPHELSGGQQQRVCIARALSTRPEFLFCDEPLTALDASVQAQIVNLLCDLRDEYAFTCLFVSHDLAMVRYISNRIGVMFRGRLVEICETDELYRHPLHPYTKELFSCIPDFRAPQKETPRSSICSPETFPPDEQGCPYVYRCPKATALCRSEKPVPVNYGNGHWCACHHDS